MTRYTVVLVAWVALATPLYGQEKTGLRFYGGAGLELVGTGDGGQFTPGLSTQAGLLLQKPGSRLGPRLGMMYYARDRSYIEGYEGSETALGASLELRYDFGRSAWRPYAVAGAGMYRLAGPDGAVNSAPQWSPAWIGGLGLRHGLGSVQIYGEARYHYFSNGDDFARHLLPVTIGIQF